MDILIKNTLHKILSDSDGESEFSSDTSNISLNTSIDTNASLNQFENKNKINILLHIGGNPKNK